VYEKARMQNPARWSGAIRNWHLADSVYLNPERTSAPTEMYKHAA
jgi:putative transposase